MLKKRVIVTGGAGFIGSALVRKLLQEENTSIMNIDNLTYAGNLNSIPTELMNTNYQFIQQDICDQDVMENLMNSFKPNLIIHLAAESHVDRSIDSPVNFLKTNILGTFSLLEASRKYWQNLKGIKAENFRFLHISTDEVFGDLEGKEDYFTESNPYAPSSPYSASKASSDHLVRAWHRTYGLPILISNCSNNYGPYQFPEKLIPVIVLNAISGLEIPIYGTGTQIRDWLFVDDHVRALMKIATKGSVGSSYIIGGGNEISNIELANEVCEILENFEINKPKGVVSYFNLITHIDDRPGHDQRYAVDCTKIKEELGWIPKESFDTGLNKTINWYINNLSWVSKTLT